MIEDRIQIDEDIKKLPFIEHYKRMWPFVKPYIFRAILAILSVFPSGRWIQLSLCRLNPIWILCW